MRYSFERQELYTRGADTLNQQALDGSIFTERAVEHGKNDVDTNGAIAGTAKVRSISLKRNKAALAMDWFRRNNHRFSSRQHGGGLSNLRIAGAQVTRLDHQLTLQEIFGVLRGEPAAIFGNADGYNLIFIFVDCLQN